MTLQNAPTRSHPDLHRIGVVIHPTRNVDEPLTALKRWAGAVDVEVGQIAFTSDERRVAEECGIVDRDLIVSIGGDGTTLAALHAAVGSDTPVLGVACGSLGILTAVQPDAVDHALDRYAAGDSTERPLPSLELILDGQPNGIAVNDVVVARHGAGQLRVTASVDDVLFARFAGDGCVVSTPLGSSAYTIAAGGPLLPLELEAFSLTPLPVHGGFRPPLVLCADSKLELEMATSYGGARLEVDGQLRHLQAKRLEVSLAPAAARLVTFPDREPFLTRLRERGIITDSPRILADDDRMGRPTT